ncbi:14141_t:CDS:2 [Entrophospora sp. SA101]|nr:14141_t:CDS:2 [Entrophospora sp. SA101]
MVSFIPDIAIMAIPALIKKIIHNPLIRALVIRAMGYVSVEMVAVDALVDSSRHSLRDQKHGVPEICCICLEGATTGQNMLIQCSQEDCDPWYCDKCLATSSEVVACILCPKRTGAFRRLKEEEGFETNGWVHLVCALWMPGMLIENPQKLTEVKIDSVNELNWKKKCCICPKEVSNQGATVCCDFSGCQNWIHITCAHDYNLLELKNNPEMVDPYFVYCKGHFSQANARLNEWVKWVREHQTVIKKARTKDQAGGTADLRNIFESSYTEYQKHRENSIIKIRKNIAQQYSKINSDRKKLQRAKELNETFQEMRNVAEAEAVELFNYLNQLKHQNADFNVVEENATNSNDSGYVAFNYKEVDKQIKTGEMEQSMDEIRAAINSVPSSVSDWNKEMVDRAKKINVKLLDSKNIESLGLLNVQKALLQREYAQKLKRES